MKKLVILAAALAAQFALFPAHAADEAKKPTAQQEKMKVCNEKATGMKGEERNKFMSDCLSAKPAAAAATPAADAKADAKSGTKSNTSQQDKMTVCNQKATGMKGDERKKFMSDCLSAKPAAAAATPAADTKADTKADAKSGAKANTSQQDKMKVCNEKAAGKKGDERNKFMSECLKG